MSTPDSFPDEQESSQLPQEAEQTDPITEEQEKEQLSSQEAELPPEAHGETNGGPLGCCLGTIAGIFLTVLLTTGIPLLLSHQALPGGIAFPLSLVGALLCGILGWQVGKRIYREYELSPRQKQKLEAWEKRQEKHKAETGLQKRR